MALPSTNHWLLIWLNPSLAAERLEPNSHPGPKHRVFANPKRCLLRYTIIWLVIVALNILRRGFSILSHDSFALFPPFFQFRFFLTDTVKDLGFIRSPRCICIPTGSRRNIRRAGSAPRNRLRLNSILASLVGFA